MAVSASAGLLSRLTNARNIARRIGNHANITPSLERNLFLVTRKYSVDINAIVDPEEEAAKPKKKLSKAMRAYLERAKEYDNFMKKEITEYEIGKRHLANMMGENPESFTQDDVNRSIKYLFPSGLFVPKARPIMEHPEKVFPPRKAAEFDETGRPYHPFFYTCTPNYYQLLHDIVANINELNIHEDLSLKKGMRPRPEDQLNVLDSNWVSKEELEKNLLEKITDDYYEKFIAAADRLVEHPYSARMKDFIGKVRKQKILQTKSFTIPECAYTPEGRPFVTVKDCKRKTARATVTVLGKGEGKITINGEDIRYFFNQQAREQPWKINEVEPWQWKLRWAEYVSRISTRLCPEIPQLLVSSSSAPPPSPLAVVVVIVIVAPCHPLSACHFLRHERDRERAKRRGVYPSRKIVQSIVNGASTSTRNIRIPRAKRKNPKKYIYIALAQRPREKPKSASRRSKAKS